MNFSVCGNFINLKAVVSVENDSTVCGYLDKLGPRFVAAFIYSQRNHTSVNARTPAKSG